MDALQALYDSQVSEDDAVAVLQCSQQYDEAIELDETEFRIVSIATTGAPAVGEAEEVVLVEERAAPRQPAEEREASRPIDEIVPVEVVAPAEERDRSRSRSRSVGRAAVEDVGVYVPQLSVDNLPTRINDPHRQCRLVPEGRPPKAIRGLRMDELAVLIQRCRLQGAWRQGGKQSRAVFVGDGFIINQEASSTWVQGVRAAQIDMRLRAARSSGQ